MGKCTYNKKLNFMFYDIAIVFTAKLRIRARAPQNPIF